MHRAKHVKCGLAMNKSSVKKGAFVLFMIFLVILGVSFVHAQTAQNATTQLPLAGSSNTSINASDPPNVSYDELLGVTFTQNFTTLACNVTAVGQNDSYGYGPAYMLNGLSNTGFWYQVGLSWNWPSGLGHESGFNMNYDVFDNYGEVVYPLFNGGIMSFSGPVNQGDSILLSLYFSKGVVVMQAYDWNTGAAASTSYNAGGASYFSGLPDERSNALGFFSGLMTEKYSVNPYYDDQWNMTPVQYTWSTPIDSAWYWMEEFNGTPGDPVFIDYSLVNFHAPLQPEYFSGYGSTLAGNAYEFFTGLSSEQQAMTFSYNVQGGGTGFSAPRLSYISNGELQEVTLGTDPRTFYLDNGSSWYVNVTLTGSSYDERWETTQTNGTANSPTVMDLTYYHQYLVTFNYHVANDGNASESSPLNPPTVECSEFGNLFSVGTGIPEWVDAGTYYTYENVLTINSAERWFAVSPVGVASFNSSPNIVYEHQYYVEIEVGTTEGGSVYPRSNWLDAGTNITFGAIANPGWVLKGWKGTGNGSYSGNQCNISLIVSSPLNETAEFDLSASSYALIMIVVAAAVAVAAAAIFRVFFWKRVSTKFVKKN